MSTIGNKIFVIALILLSTAVYAINPPCESEVKNNIQSPILTTDSINVNITWRIENEIEIENVLLEVSSDGVTFEKVATYKLKGEETSFLKYKFQTNKPQLKGTVYYRFKQLNKNSKMYCYEPMKVDLK